MKLHTILFVLVLALSQVAMADILPNRQDASNFTDQTVSLNDVKINSGGVYNITSNAQVTVAGNNPVTVGQNGSIKLTAGKSIVLLPGTKISSGGFMYASITKTGKSGKHDKKITRLVTIEENQKIEEQENLSLAVARFSPFPSARKGQLHPSSSKGSSLSIFNCRESGLAQEQTIKLTAVSNTLLRDILNPTFYNFSNAITYCKAITHCSYVLRL